MSGDATATAGPYLTDRLRGLDQCLRQLVPRIVSSRDEDAVHDLRVVLRRTRTVLEIGSPILGRFPCGEVRHLLRDMQRATGALRDEEVLLDLVGALGVDDANLAAWLEVRRRRERGLRRVLVHRVEAGELERGLHLLEALLAFRVDPSRDRRLSKLAGRSVAEARRRVERRRTPWNDDPMALHRLRIAYKRLRYVVETFAEALPADLATLGQPAARMQNRLGAVHDVDVVLGCVARARLLSPTTRRKVLLALESVRQQRVARCLAETAGAGPGLAVAHASGATGLRNSSTR
jgi:CHAD domain-containing protein